MCLLCVTIARARSGVTLLAITTQKGAASVL